MSEEKKNSQKRQTKAGMLAKKQNRTATRDKDKTALEKDAEQTPKISKEKAEKRTSDKPIH